jgi:hypothetical protein
LHNNKNSENLPEVSWCVYALFKNVADMEWVRTEIIRIVKHCPGYLVHLHSFRFKGHSRPARHTATTAQLTMVVFVLALRVERQHERSYNENYTPSRPLWEVKSHLAWSVVRWVTTCEARVLFVLFCNARAWVLI